MSVKGRGIEITRHWVRWVVRVVIETGSGMDYDTYTEDYSGVEWCNKKNALNELKGDNHIMKVTLIWDDGTLTRLQGANALKIAQHWLYKYIDLLAVFCSTTQTMYLKEG